MCRLLDQADVARLTGARDATGKASSQGPVRSCEYTVTTESGNTASVFLDVTEQRAQQLYDLATSGLPVIALPVGGLKASYDPSSGKVYVLTTKAFFSIQLPSSFGALTTDDGLRTAAEDLATEAVQRIGR